MSPSAETVRTDECDVVVVGGGNAGFSAAHAARERGRSVLLLDKGGADDAGGNSYYTAGAFRIAHDGIREISDLIDADDRDSTAVLDPYSRAEFTGDVVKVTGGNNDADLTRALVDDSQRALRWLHGKGLRFRLMYERQAYPDAEGRQVFWGGLAVGSTGGGKGLVEQHTRAARASGVRIRYGVRAQQLLREGDAVTGVRCFDEQGEELVVRAASVVLAAGGFEADPELRAEHLGPQWRHAKVRGTPHNTGDMLRAAIDAGAATHGDWNTCHSVAWDARHPHNEHNRELTNQLTRGGYPLGIVVNERGQRFLDEGADFRNLTYAKYGAEILAQPGAAAFQLFDATTRARLRTEEYDMPGVSEITARTVPELAEAAGIDAAELTRTVEEFNAAVDRTAPFDPAVLDGRAAQVRPPKSNWANPLETAPFHAFPVTCGITFTFGGLRADPTGRVLGTDDRPIPGLLVCGEMLGGLFSGNYPGGTGLTSGAVFGRRAGAQA